MPARTQGWASLAIRIALILVAAVAVTILTVGVMIGSFVIGLSAGERITVLQGIGVSLAVGGVVLANLSPK